MKIILTLVLSLSSFAAGASPFVLEKEYINHAWGYQHNGCAVDEMGNVYIYSVESKMPLKILRTVAVKEVESLHALIYEASQETFKSTHTAFDAGVSSWMAHLGGQPVLLKQQGDFEGMNSTAAAKTLVEMIDLWCSVK